MLQSVKGILLKTIKYGDTSLIANIFTDVFGLQTYMIKGARSNRNKRNNTGLLQPSSLLNMVVYHQPGKNFQTIKEYAVSEDQVYFHDNAIKNCIAIFSIELLHNLLKTDDPQQDLFSFSYHFLKTLGTTETAHCSNLPIYFLLNASRICGYQISGNYNNQTPHLDIYNGNFSMIETALPPTIEAKDAASLSAVLQSNNIMLLLLTAAQRQKIMEYYLLFLQIHVPGFKTLKSLPILSTILH